jgi:hypothetical protein
MNTFATLRDALFALVNEADIESVIGETWQFAYKHPVKQPPGYPGFCVVPARNGPPVSVDSGTVEVPFTFWVFLFYSFEDGSLAEDRLIGMADVIYDTLLANLKGASPLENAAFDGHPSGEWGFDAEHGERFYRIEVTARVTKDIELLP